MSHESDFDASAIQESNNPSQPNLAQWLRGDMIPSNSYKSPEQIKARELEHQAKVEKASNHDKGDWLG